MNLSSSGRMTQVFFLIKRQTFIFPTEEQQYASDSTYIKDSSLDAHDVLRLSYNCMYCGSKKRCQDKSTVIIKKKSVHTFQWAGFSIIVLLMWATHAVSHILILHHLSSDSLFKYQFIFKLAQGKVKPWCQVFLIVKKHLSHNTSKIRGGGSSIHAAVVGWESKKTTTTAKDDLIKKQKKTLVCPTLLKHKHV